MKKKYIYTNIVGHIENIWSIGRDEIDEMLMINNIYPDTILTMTKEQFRDMVHSILICHIRHTKTRYEKAIHGGVRGKKYINTKRYYSSKAKYILKRLEK